MRAVGLLLHQYEDTDAFTFGFQSLKDLLDTVVEDENPDGFDLDYMIADAGTAINPSLVQVWPFCT